MLLRLNKKLITRSAIDNYLTRVNTIYYRMTATTNRLTIIKAYLFESPTLPKDSAASLQLSRHLSFIRNRQRVEFLKDIQTSSFY